MSELNLDQLVETNSVLIQFEPWFFPDPIAQWIILVVTVVPDTNLNTETECNRIEWKTLNIITLGPGSYDHIIFIQ